jgi:SNF2 family DNA or RNA helicase
MAKDLPQSLSRLVKPSGLSNAIWSELDDYQRKAVNFALLKKHAFLLFRQGTGKTWIGSGIIENMMPLFGSEFRAVLSVPLTNLESSWLPVLSRLPGLSIVRTFEELKASKKSKTPTLWITNPEGFEKHRQKFKRLKLSLTMLDECQRIRNRNSISSKAARALGRVSEYRVAMTGTPMDKNPLELWSIFSFVNPDVLGLWTDFLAGFAVPVPEFDWAKYKAKPALRQAALRKHRIEHGKPQFNFDTFDAFMDRVRPWMLIQDDDVLNLPPMKELVIKVKMTPRQKTMYDQLKRTLVLNITKEATLSVGTKGVLVWKLHQLASGFIKDEDGTVHRIAYTKVERVARLVRNLSEPVVIFAKYVHEVRAIWERLRDDYRVGVIYGRTKESDRARVQEFFQAGKLDVIVLQVKTGGVGIDLFYARTSIFFNLTHSFIDYDQAKARTRRRGQTRQTRAFLLLSQGTIDEPLWVLVRQKRKVTIRMIADKLKEESHNGQGSKVEG